MRVTDVGEYYIREDDRSNDKDIWQMVAFCEHPSATLRNVRNGEIMRGAIGCLLLRPFVKLVPEKEAK